MRRLFSVLFILCVFTSFSQTNSGEETVKLSVSGYVKSDVIFDTRQNVAVREGHFYLYPLNESLDSYGDDVNARPNFNILSIQTRLKGTITGPDAFGAKTSAVIEAAFFGHSETDVNGFRLRHAFAKLNWENTELLVGQYWHAMFITDCYPGTVSFNTGAPFQPFSRNPQIRLTQQAGDLKLILTALSQRDFVSTGPDSGSSKYLRNGVLPEMNFTLQYSSSGNGKSILAGAGIDYLSLLPGLATTEGIKTSERVNGFSGMAFLKCTTPDITFKLEGIYGQNTTHLTMLGGYAVKDIVNMSTGLQEYVPINTMSVWSELNTNGTNFQFGLFAGYTKNKGAGEDIIPIFYSRGSNIDYVYRIAPRIIFNSGKMRFAGELERTAAAYGTIDSDGSVLDSKEVCNLRFLFGVYYFF